MLVLQQRVVLHPHDLVAMLLIEERRLEAESIELNPVAASRSSLRFRGGEETRAVSMATKVLAHPEGLHLRAATPRPAVETGGDTSTVVADEGGEPSPVVDPRLLDVVGIELVFEEADVIGFGRALELRDGQVHGVSRC